jgi:hypothetical protein
VNSEITDAELNTLDELYAVAKAKGNSSAQKWIDQAPPEIQARAETEAEDAKDEWCYAVHARWPVISRTLRTLRQRQ